MKKLVLGVLIFAVISFSATGIFIRIKNNKADIIEEEKFDNILEEKNENESFSGNIVGNSKEKTIDLYGTYDQNDLIIEETIEKVELLTTNVDLKIPKIKGMKNKNIEEKINNDIKKRVIEKIGNIFIGNNYSDINTYVDMEYDYSNFSNVISYIFYINYDLDGERKLDKIYLNYELINGERLRFEDLFVKDADLYSIVRKIVYSQLAKIVSGNEEKGSVYYDEENRKWLYNQYDYVTGEELKIEYIPSLTENDINKIIEKFINEEEKMFYFTPTKINIDISKYGNYYSNILHMYLKDIANDVVIYDKYITKESIFETDGIGLENLWTCSEPIRRSSYVDYGFLEENLYYDINMSGSYGDTNFPFQKSLLKTKDKLTEESKNVLEEYRSMAKENPDNFFILGINSQCSTNDSIGSSNGYNSLISTSINVYLTTTDINYKEKVINELLSSYRYYNLVFYNSALEYAGYFYDKTSSNDYEENIVFDSFEHKEKNKTYDARNLKEITSINEVFNGNYSYYRNMLIDKLKMELGRRKPDLNIEEISKLAEEAVLSVNAYGIDARVTGFDDEFQIMSYNELDKSNFTIYDLDMYIIPSSNIRRIGKIDTLSLDLEELNIAYNEIFARYGHEFKNKELKEYFELCDWYTQIDGKSVSVEELNEVEKYNLDIIKSAIADKK